MAMTIFDVLTKNINEEISSAQRFLTSGSPKDYADYREVVGLIRGLESSKQHVEDLAKNYMENDDD